MYESGHAAPPTARPKSSEVPDSVLTRELFEHVGHFILAVANMDVALTDLTVAVFGLTEHPASLPLVHSLDSNKKLALILAAAQHMKNPAEMKRGFKGVKERYERLGRKRNAAAHGSFTCLDGRWALAPRSLQQVLKADWSDTVLFADEIAERALEAHNLARELSQLKNAFDR